MARKRLSVVTVLFLLLLSTVSLTLNAQTSDSSNSFLKWEITSYKDPMTGKETWFATSPVVKSLVPMSFPYTFTNAYIAVGIDGTKEFGCIVFNVIPNIIEYKLEDKYCVITTRIKWDEEQPEYVRLLQVFGSKFLFFDMKNYHDIISKIMKHKKLLIELKWFGEGLVYFEFPLEGAKETIETIRSKFRN